MGNGDLKFTGSDLGLGLFASIASAGVQGLGPFQHMFGYYPDNFQAIIVPLSAIVVGVAVSVTLFFCNSLPVNTIRTFSVRVFLLLLAAVLAFVVLTAGFVVEIPDNVDQRSYHVIVGIAKRPLPKCGSEPCATIEACIRRRGLTREGGIICSGGRGRVILAETAIFATYLMVALALGCVGALLRIGQVVHPAPAPSPPPSPPPPPPPPPGGAGVARPPAHGR